MEQPKDLPFDADKALNVFKAIMKMLEEEDYRGTDFFLGVGAAIRAVVHDNFPSNDPDIVLKMAMKFVELGTNIPAPSEMDSSS